MSWWGWLGIVLIVLSLMETILNNWDYKVPDSEKILTNEYFLWVVIAWMLVWSAFQ